MTIVEAAAFGVPSLLHSGTIGAKDLLPPAARFETGAPLASDFPRPLLNDFPRPRLSALSCPDMEDAAAAGAALAAALGKGEAALAAVGAAARGAALGWGIEAFRGRLEQTLAEAAR